MTTIELKTKIEAPIETVFNLSRDIDFHMESASRTKEVAISGKTKGLISLDETVTWRGKHFGCYLKHTSKIIKMQEPREFTDLMTKGHFTYFCHDHFFEEHNGLTIMKDILRYKTPYGIFGRIFNSLFLKNHLTEFLEKRNHAIKMKAQKNAP